ncbi:MAG: thioredoxin family protein [Ruminococcus sp.]|nr:thioredoxin family protein [Ruminococcus sp.]
MKKFPFQEKICILLCLLTVVMVVLLLHLGAMIWQNNESIQYDAKTTEDINAVLQAEKPAIIVFGADYCPTCENYIPYIKELNELYGHKITIKFVDTVKNEEIRNVYNIELIPSTIFFESDKKVYMPDGNLEIDDSERYDGKIRYSSETVRVISGESVDANTAFEYGQTEYGEMAYCKYIGLIDMVHLKQIATDLINE